MDTLANSEDPNEMQHNAAFHQVLQCLLRFKQPSVAEIHNNLESSTFYPLKYKMGNPILYQYACKNPSGHKDKYMYTSTKRLRRDCNGTCIE